MFRRQPDFHVPTVPVTVEGREIAVPQGASAAAALLLAGFVTIRETPVSTAPRAPYCLMGVCFDCLAEIEGLGAVQACLVPVREGMRVRRLAARRELAQGISQEIAS